MHFYDSCFKILVRLFHYLIHLVLVSVQYVFLLKLCFSWFLVWRVIFYCIPNILSIMVEDARSYLVLIFQQAGTLFRLSMQVAMYF